MTRRLTATEALARIWQIDPVLSGSESDSNDEMEITNNVIEHVESGDESSQSSDSDHVENDSDENVQPQPATTSSLGSAWRCIALGANNTLLGRTEQRNVFRETPGLKTSVSRSINTPYDAWKCFINEPILRHIQRCTNNFAPELELTLSQLENFIGLQYARGIYGNHHSVHFLWSSKFGCKLFSNAMSRNDFFKIKKSIRFDDKRTRNERVTRDQFTHIRDIFELFADNCRKTFTPGYSLCIDEQLMPLKSRCRFITYMPNKPDKYGVKFWLLVDNDTKYIYNIIPYLGKIDNEGSKQNGLAHDVVMNLLRPLLNKGYNITVDNFFPSMPLIKDLNRQKTTLVGTVRCNRKGLPTNLSKAKNLPLHNSEFYWNDEEDCLLVKYQCKKKKSAFVISTMHRNPAVDIDSDKKKPLVVLFYNKNKCGVDISDSMLRLYTTRCATRRWPLAIWQNILDVAALNAWICFRKATNSNLTRKDFILKLIENICKTKETQRDHEFLDLAQPVLLFGAKRQKCFQTGCKNKTNVICKICKKFLCGTHCLNEVTKVSMTICNVCENI